MVQHALNTARSGVSTWRRSAAGPAIGAGVRVGGELGQHLHEPEQAAGRRSAGIPSMICRAFSAATAREDDSAPRTLKQRLDDAHFRERRGERLAPRLGEHTTIAWWRLSRIDFSASTRCAEVRPEHTDRRCHKRRRVADVALAGLSASASARIRMVNAIGTGCRRRVSVEQGQEAPSGTVTFRTADASVLTLDRRPVGSDAILVQFSQGRANTGRGCGAYDLRKNTAGRETRP